MTSDQDLLALAEKVSPGNLDTATKSGGFGCIEHDKLYKCPACDGDGEVDGSTYCNLDNVSMGVQFFGVGNDHGVYEAYFRAASPSRIKALILEKQASESRIAELEGSATPGRGGLRMRATWATIITMPSPARTAIQTA